MMPTVATAVSMTDEEFRLLRDFICEYCGIHFPESMRFLVERRLGPRLAVHGLPSFREYYRLVKYGREREHEMDEIVERVTTNETYFFRERYQLDAFINEILPLLLGGRKAGERLRIWSAGCSSGEEPYTVAMMLAEEPSVRGLEVDILGNDISRKVVRSARVGLYTRSSFRETPAEVLARYFTVVGRAYQLTDGIRNAVSFGHLNLMDTTALAVINNVDVIFCRNVMIYFDARSRARLVETFRRKLKPGGFLLLGHAESLINEATELETVPLRHDIVYRRPGVTPAREV